MKSALRFLPTSQQVSVPGARVEAVLWLAARFGWKTRSNGALATHPRPASERRPPRADAYEHRVHQTGDSDILAAWLLAVIVLLLLFAFAKGSLCAPIRLASCTR